MFKKLFSIGFFAILIFSGLYLYFIFPYNVGNTKDNVEKAVTKRINKTEATEKYVTLSSFKRIDKTNTFIAVYVVSGDKYYRKNNLLGFSVLKKGINGKLRISTSNYGTNLIDYETTKTNKGKYVVFVGGNENGTLDTLSVSFRTIKEKLLFKIPSDEYFIVYKKVSKDFNETQFPEFELVEKKS